VRVHETHASWVFVAGARAYKVKKPLALGFLDYSTLALRRAACREEVRVNRALAPDVYLAVRAIVPVGAGEGERAGARTDTRTESGGTESSGGRDSRDGGADYEFADADTPGAVEYAVEMRTFDERATLAGLIAADALTAAQIEAVAARIAAFHRDAEVVRGWRPADALALWRKNVAELRAAGPPPEWDVELAEGFAAAFVAAHESELRARARAGLIRDCHGDLRCEHVLPGPPVRVVDRIEFDPGLRRVDVARDLAFLAMELEALGRGWAARALIAAYRAAGGDPGSAALQAFYGAHCALVRAKVALIAGGEARRLWDLAERLCWRARGPLALVVCGPAASGKSTLAAELARRAGLEVVSSDAVRKRLARIEQHERAAAEHYTAEFNRATYAEVGREALRVLRRAAGSADSEERAEHGEAREQGAAPTGVIVDATCRARVDRAPLLDALRGSGARLLAVRCEVPPSVALERARRRMRDPARVSDATPAVVATQLAEFEELDELPAECVLRVDAGRAVGAQVAGVARALDGAVRFTDRAPRPT
jgi:hypothetical protein